MGTVAKALSLLSYFNRTQNQIGLSDLSRMSGQNKATVHRMMSELQDQGFVEQVGTGREYRLGTAFLRLASLREAAVPTRDLAHQILADLSASTHETAHFSTLQGDTLSTLAYTYSPLHGTRVTMEDADILAFHATSSGLAVLAFSTSEFVDKTLSMPLEKCTHRTTTNPRDIREMLGPIRETCIAESNGGFEDDVHSHAMPVFNAAQICIGSLAVATPTARMNDTLKSTIRSELCHHSIRLTRLLGGFLPDGFEDRAIKHTTNRTTP